MATEFQLILLVIAAVAGGVLNALLGWSDSGEAFVARKFLASILRSAIGAAAAAFTFQGITDVNIWIYLQSFLTGAGIDVLGQRLQKVLTPSKEEKKPEI